MEIPSTRLASPYSRVGCTPATTQLFLPRFPLNSVAIWKISSTRLASPYSRVDCTPVITLLLSSMIPTELCCYMENTEHAPTLAIKSFWLRSTRHYSPFLDDSLSAQRNRRGRSSG